jgi:uncharacterized membrane protein YfcA
MAAIQGLTTLETLFTTTVCLLPLLIGIVVGSRLFVNVDEASFRRHVLILLMVLSIAGLIRSVFF